MSRAKGLAAALMCAVLAAFDCAHADTAREEVLAGIDIERRDKQAQISIRFAVPAGYLRHTPAESGKTLRIYPQLSGAAQHGLPAVMRPPPTDMVPGFTVTYLDADNALLVEFDQPTAFAVDAGPDGRTIRITVPVLPGAKDWFVVSLGVPIFPEAPRSPAPEPAATEVSDAQSTDTLETAESAFDASAFASAQIVGYAGGGNGAYALRMNSLKQVRFATVVQQEQDWSCGSAAVATLLTYHYGYPMSERYALEAMFARGNQTKIRNEGFSLLDLKQFLDSLGFQANGFETSIERLAQVGVPAIVVINDGGYNHFVVVKGLRHGNVLLGDPAKGTRVLLRSEFDAMWENRIVFVITNRREGVAFNARDDWRYMMAPLGNAVARESLAGMLLFRPGPNDF